MSEKTGMIEKVSSATRNTRYGSKEVFSIQVDGDWYGCGFDPLPAGAVEGATVSFSTAVNGKYTNADCKTMQVVSGPSAAPSAGSGTSPKGGHDDPRQRVIVYQSARNAAIDAIALMQQLEVVSLPAKKADKYDAFFALLNEVTDRFHVDAMAVYTGDLIIQDPTTMPSEVPAEDEE